MKDRMDRGASSLNGGPSRAHASAELSSAALFALLWDGLADLLGTAASATLLRRAAQRAAPRDPELAELEIVRENLEYRYTLPSAWSDPAEGTQRALRAARGRASIPPRGADRAARGQPPRANSRASRAGDRPSAEGRTMSSNQPRVERVATGSA